MKAGDLPAAYFPATGAAAARHVFYVSPQGNDRWSGAAPLADAQRASGPFATLETARDSARKAGGPATIVMGGGDYYLASPVVFGPQDAGLAVLAKCGETPVLHGGPPVTKWSSQGGGRWVAPLRLPSGQSVGDLFVDGIVQDEARYPNAPDDNDPRKGWLFADKPDVDAWLGNIRFRFRPGDLPALKDAAGLVAHIVGGFLPGSQWGSDTLPVLSIDAGTRTIHTGGTAYFFSAEGSRYFLSGSRALLDAPREWWYDATAGQLSYMPATPSFTSAKIVAGVLPTFLRLEDADGMTISGLTFRDGAPQGSGKYGTDMRGFGAIRLEHSDGVRLVGNVIDNVGVGIHVSESENVLIAHNEIGHVAGDGIYIGTVYGKFGKSSGAKVLANHIHDIGRVYFESSGIWFHAADNVRIAGNLVEDTAQLGIAGGSIWESNDAIHNAVIEHNEVRNANRQTADGGAIKLMGTQADLQNSIIRANVVTGTRQLMNRADGTFWPTDYENTDEWPSPISWAIYTDLKASGVRIEGNVLCGNVAAIGINGGWNNVVTGNFIAQGSGAAFRLDDGTGRDWKPAWAKPNRIEDNTVSIGGGGLAAAVYAPGHGSAYGEFRQNRYSGDLGDRSFKIEPEIMPSGKYGSLADFQKEGGESGSILLPAQAADDAAKYCR
ncbi:MAG TPA: right-handed parallel beta-helix repeat-containing protein [Mesorhizobium sp.]